MHLKSIRKGILIVAAVAYISLQYGCKGTNTDKQTKDSLVINNNTTDAAVNARLDTQTVKSETVIPPAADTAGTAQPDNAAPPAGVKAPEASLPGGSDFKQDTTKKYVYLTFDDGPQPGTMNVYHILRKLGIRGTFFYGGAARNFWAGHA